MTRLLPVAQGVAVWVGLKAAARAGKAAGDQRSESQLMADLFVERLTGAAECWTTDPGGTPSEVRTPTGHAYRSNAPPALPPMV